MDLEKKLSEVQKEVVEGGGATRKSRLATDWIPRPPERYIGLGVHIPYPQLSTQTLLIHRLLFLILQILNASFNFLFILLFRYELSGHRAPVTRVLFHPVFL